MRMNRGFDVVVIDEAAQAVRSSLLLSLQCLNFFFAFCLILESQYCIPNINIIACILGPDITLYDSMENCYLGAGRAFNIGATSTWVPTSISGMSFYLWKDTCCSHLS